MELSVTIYLNYSHSFPNIDELSLHLCKSTLILTYTFFNTKIIKSKNGIYSNRTLH